MKRVILASGSPQRKKLLKLLGLKFTVQPSRTKELKKVTSTCSALVKDNALLKARDIAAKHKKGVVIGADTVVYIGNKKIIGKPKSYQDARRKLKILFSRPQWVYTGVAVIDVKTGRTLVDYEKTKVYMLRLSNKEIDSYHRKVRPFDKAGGFDIEGWGSAFIHRIEGCYSNVIGLPMAKLATMLKKVGVSVLCLFAAIAVSGCTTEYNLATGKQETSLYTTEKEVNIGDRVAASIEKQYDQVADVELTTRVEEILDRLAAVSDRTDIVYFIKVIEGKEDDIVNAVSLPGGYIYLFKGLTDKLKTDDELAGVIAHEMGHITARHGVKRLQNSYKYLLIQLAAIEAGGNVSAGVNLAINSVFMEHAQEDEFESDRLAVKYMKKAGYDPNAMVKVLRVLKEAQDKGGVQRFSYWRTHPHISKRIAIVNEAITGKMEFRDWLNITQDEF